LNKVLEPSAGSLCLKSVDPTLPHQTALSLFPVGIDWYQT
jgi:hypothetical protein